MSDGLTYLVVIEHSEGTGYSAWAPDLPAVIAATSTREECEHLMGGATAFHSEGLREHGEPIPEPSAVASALVSVPAA